MNVTVYSHEHYIGRGQLHLLNASQGQVGGTIGWQSTCHPDIVHFRQQLHDINSGMPLRDDMNMQTLRISVKSETRYFLFPKHDFMLVDQSRFDSAGKLIEDRFKLQAVGVFDHFNRDFFLAAASAKHSHSIDSWLHPDWQSVTPKVKNELEDRVYDIVGTSYAAAIPPALNAQAHPLAKYRFCAMAHSAKHSCTLFAVRNRENLPHKYILIKLQEVDELDQRAGLRIIFTRFFQSLDLVRHFMNKI